MFDYLVRETNRSAAIMDVDLDAKTGDGRTPMLICAELGETLGSRVWCKLTWADHGEGWCKGLGSVQAHLGRRW